MTRVNHFPAGDAAIESSSRRLEFSKMNSESELVNRSSSVAGSFSSVFTVDADERFAWTSASRILPPDEILTINVGGSLYQTRSSTLARLPNSLLADPKRREEHYEPGSKTYFFDRNRLAFDSILEFYRTGKLVKPTTVPVFIFVREMLFFELGEKMVEDFLKAEELYDEPVVLPENKIQKLVFDLFNCPDSSLAARVLAVVDVTLVVTAIVSLCVITLPQFQNAEERVNAENGTEKFLHTKAEFRENKMSNPFFVVDVVCNSWFIFDISVRFFVSPKKKLFFCDFMTLVDVVSVSPFLVDLIATTVTNNHYSGPSIAFLLAFRILRMFRVFKIFRMDEYSDGLKVLTQTIRTGHKELGIMGLFLVVGAVFFSATMFYAERGTPNTDYTSIPASFWWAVITWTTIGYGDIYPKTPSGKVVGCICAITGVLALGMMIPPIVRRFEHYFYRVQNMQELEAIFKDHQDSKRKEKTRLNLKPSNNSSEREFYANLA